MTIKISIITTSYKHQDFIAETIESVLAQTFIDWELLIWDDSPDDLTWNVIQKYVKKYPNKIKAWHHSPNKWIVDNMNFLIERVSKESNYIAFLEWDDLFIADNLEKKLKIFEEYTEVKLVYNNLDFIDWNSKVFYKDFLRKAPFYLKNQKLSKKIFIKYETFYLSYSSLMIKKDVLLDEKIINPTNDKLYSVSDWDLFFRISAKYNCYWIEDSLTLYRRHENNFSFSQNGKILFDLEKAISFYKETNFINKKEINLFKWKESLWKCNFLLEKWEKSKAFIKYVKSIYLFPTYNIKSKILTLIRFLIPYKVQIYILNKYYFK